MSELKNIFSKLSEYYRDNSISWIKIAELYENDNDVSKSADKKDFNNKKSIFELPFVRRALKRDLAEEQHSTMMELCTAIRGLCGNDSRTTYYETEDCWKEISTIASCGSYLAYIYALAGLSNLHHKSDYALCKLSLAAVNTYFLSLTIPGAKGFHVFDEEIIVHCLGIFTLTERIQNTDLLQGWQKHQSVEIWIRLTTLCDDLKLLLRFAHFKDNTNVRDSLLKKLINILHLNIERGYANTYASNLNNSCFEVFDELIHAHNGEPEETLSKILNMTVFLHTYPSKPKCVTGGMLISNSDCKHISDWFINSISKCPRLLVKTLRFYIECIVTNPLKSWKTEQVQRSLDYAAKYDAALFTKCNESCCDFLCEAVYAEEVMIRVRSVELMSRILLLESKVNWQMFRDEISDIPREVYLIKELCLCLCDNNNTVKLRSIQALQMALSKGSPNAKKIMIEGIRYAKFEDINIMLPVEPRVSKNEIRFKIPKAQMAHYTFEGHGIVELSFLNLPNYVFDRFFRSSVSNLRRAGISFMEHYVMLNPLAIFKTKFISEIMLFVDEPTALVRKQVMQTIDVLLNSFPCYCVIFAWCKLIIPMLKDADAKNTEFAMSCFQQRVLLNLKPLEQSNKAEHFMPWVIIRTMLSTGSRLYLQVCFNNSLRQSLVSSQMLSIIESHLLTSNSTEAWTVLNFIAGKIKSKEPDALIYMFISQPSWNKEHNMLLAIEVIANCIKHFSHTALNLAFNHIFASIRNGKMLPALIGKAFDLLILIDQQQYQKQKTSESLNERRWVDELHQHLKNSILLHISEFPDNYATLMSYLFAYSEVNVQTRERPDTAIIDFVQKYMGDCLKIEENELGLENERLLNSMIIISGRFSLRDPCMAATTCGIYDSILRSRDHPPTINTIIVSLTDICKKHTHVVEGIIGRMLSKLASPFFINRMETFKCFEKLILQDQLKLRDNLLLSLLTSLLDDNEELVARASHFFHEYTSKKNNTLFDRCLVEYPFVLNEYKNFVSNNNFWDRSTRSPLKGDSQQKKRQTLYNYFMLRMDEINLILYFNQLKLIAEKCKSDPMMNSSEGIYVLKDIFFILKRVCQLTKDKKSLSENKGSAEDKTDDAIDMVESCEPETLATVVNSSNTPSSSGRGRRRRDIVTLEDAHIALKKSLVFIPVIFKDIVESCPSVGKYFDDFCTVLAKRFPKYVNDPHLINFWKKYCNTCEIYENNQRRKRKSDFDELFGTDDEMDQEYEVRHHKTIAEQGELVLDAHVFPIIRDRQQSLSPSKRLRLQPPSTLMEYVFHPNVLN